MCKKAVDRALKEAQKDAYKAKDWDCLPAEVLQDQELPLWQDVSFLCQASWRSDNLIIASLKKNNCTVAVAWSCRESEGSRLQHCRSQAFCACAGVQRSRAKAMALSAFIEAISSGNSPQLSHRNLLEVKQSCVFTRTDLQAIQQIHYPESLQELEAARRHFVFTELYLWQLNLILWGKFRR